MQQLLEIIEELKARQKELEAAVERQWRALSMQSSSSSQPHTPADEAQALEQMESASNNLEVIRLRRALHTRISEYEAAMAVMQDRAADREEGMRALGEAAVDEIRGQLVELQARQASMEASLAARVSNVTRREQAAHLREKALSEREFQLQLANVKIQTTQHIITAFYECLRDGWAHYAGGDIEKSMHFFDRGIKLPDLDPSLVSRGLMAMGFSVHGWVPTGSTYLTSRQYITQALENNPRSSEGWNNLGELLSPNEEVKVGTYMCTRKQCFIKALELNPCSSEGWNNLGELLSPDETVVVNGTPYTRKECFIKALELNPCSP